VSTVEDYHAKSMTRHRDHARDIPCLCAGQAGGYPAPPSGQHAASAYLIKQGITALPVRDGRQSERPVAFDSQCSPEAAVEGTLAVLRTGDRVRIDLAKAAAKMCAFRRGAHARCRAECGPAATNTRCHKHPGRSCNARV